MGALVPEGIKTARPCVYLVRAASAHLTAFTSGAPPSNAAKAMMFADDRVTDVILRAATGPATTTTIGWAQQLAGVAILDLVQSITSISAAAEVIDRGLKTNLDRIAELRIPSRVLNASAAGQWVAEGEP